MSETMFDLFDCIFKYKGRSVHIIIDNKNKPWFSAADLAHLLKYDHMANVTRHNVQPRDKKTYEELEMFVNIKQKNAQPKAVYINETGLYYFVFGSQKDLAKKFKDWVLRVVLPSIRQYGYYQMEEGYKNQIRDLNDKLRIERSIVRTLENNQKRPKFPDGGLVYALEPMGLIPRKKGLKIIRIGKSEWMNGRWNTYNTAVPDNFKLVHLVEVDDPTGVERCIQGLLSKYIYRTGKDYYVTTIKIIKNVFDGCADHVKHGHFPMSCIGCGESMPSLDTLMDHTKTNHNGIFMSKDIEDFSFLPANGERIQITLDDLVLPDLILHPANNKMITQRAGTDEPLTESLVSENSQDGDETDVISIDMKNLITDIPPHRSERSDNTENDYYKQYTYKQSPYRVEKYLNQKPPQNVMNIKNSSFHFAPSEQGKE